MPCENCRNSACDGGANCPVEAIWALSGQSPYYGPDGQRLAPEPMGQPAEPPDDLPDGVRGWSWGAFLLTWIWAIGNRQWIGLPALVLYLCSAIEIGSEFRYFHFLPLALTPYIGIVFAVWLGAKGRETAWRRGKWDSLEHFNRVQHKWTVAGIWCLVLAALAAAGFLLWFYQVIWEP